MKVFLIACAAAIIFAVASVFVLNEMQEPADVAYTSSTGVRL